MFNYIAFGLNIYSEIELPGVLKAEKLKNADVKIISGNVTLPDNNNKENYIVQNKDVYIWWDKIGKVKIHNSKEIIVDVVEESTLPILLGPVMSLLLYRKGFLVLHGSAVNLNNLAVAFLGYCGYGKSTTAINFYNRGYPLVTDDILAISFNDNNELLVYPGYPHLRLSESCYNNLKKNREHVKLIHTIVGKFFCEASKGFSSEPLKLERIYLLDKSDETKIFSSNSQEDLLNLITHSTAKHFIESKDQAVNLFKCSKLINNVDIKCLKLNHRLDETNVLLKLIEKDLKLNK